MKSMVVSEKNRVKGPSVRLGEPRKTLSRSLKGRPGENVQYRQGSYGRVFLLKFDDRDDLLEEIKRLAVKEQIKVATITLLGGMRSAAIVTGPKEPVIPPEPIWSAFQDGREVLGIGSLFWKEDGPAIHLHGAVGRGNETHVGCMRKDSSVYLVIEAVIAEIAGIEARKVVNERTGLAMLDLQ
jgi:predicted DNA-binding protein with PD1-like motif